MANFELPDTYPPPIRVVLTKLHAGLPISDRQAWIFKIALALEAVQPTNGIAVGRVAS